MWNEWCIDDLSGPSAGPWYLGGSDLAHSAPSDDGSWLDGAWSIGIAALLGIAAYEGVRRLAGRSRYPSPDQSYPPPISARPEPTKKGSNGVGAAHRRPIDAVEADGASEPEEIDLLGELVALHDLVPTDALRRRIVRTLGRAGVEPVSTTGVPFDDQRHDVMGTVAATAETPAGTVTEIVRPGFVDSRGRVLRPAEVVVATEADGAW